MLQSKTMKLTNENIREADEFGSAGLPTIAMQSAYAEHRGHLEGFAALAQAIASDPVRLEKWNRAWAMRKAGVAADEVSRIVYGL